MVLLPPGTNPTKGIPVPDDVCTYDHVYEVNHPARKLFALGIRAPRTNVAACYKCNNKRGLDYSRTGCKVADDWFTDGDFTSVVITKFKRAFVFKRPTWRFKVLIEFKKKQQINIDANVISALVK